MKLIFDLDGTLFASGDLAINAYKEVFKRMGLEAPEDKELVLTLGYPIEEIWQILLPNNEDKRVEAQLMMEEVENEMIRNGEASLYPDVIKVLQKLKNKGHSLYILSNCDEPYMNVISEKFKFGNLFEKQFCAGMFDHLTKSEILAKILEGSKDGMIVGDRFHDIQAGKDNNIKTIWCNYGYSDVKLDADYEVKEFKEILDIISKF